MSKMSRGLLDSMDRFAIDSNDRQSSSRSDGRGARHAAVGRG
jgi:hypothetical protein